MITLETLVRLRAADPWSFTVLDTLARKAGFEDIVAVTRLKSWRLDIQGVDADGALALVRKLLSETALLANPNRDTWYIRGPDLSGSEALWRPGCDTSAAFAVRVADSDDIAGKSLTRVVRGRLGLTQIVAAHFAFVWLLELRGGGPGARATAEKVAVARSWRKGLLSNPHFQTAEVFEAASYLAEGEVG